MDFAPLYDTAGNLSMGNRMTGTGSLLKPPTNLVDPNKLLADQLTNLQTTLGVQKDKDLAKLDAALAARGISRSGALGAGTANIATGYANALASGTADINKEANSYNLQYQDMLNKYYQALRGNSGGASGYSGKSNPAGDTSGAAFTGRKPGEPMYPPLTY